VKEGWLVLHVCRALQGNHGVEGAIGKVVVEKILLPELGLGAKRNRGAPGFLRLACGEGEAHDPGTERLSQQSGRVTIARSHVTDPTVGFQGRFSPHLLHQLVHSLPGTLAAPGP
jgi:hypothetical protein